MQFIRKGEIHKAQYGPNLKGKPNVFFSLNYINNLSTCKVKVKYSNRSKFPYLNEQD